MVVGKNSARAKWIEARAGKHKVDSMLLKEAYEMVRAFGLGYMACLIDSSPEVLNSLRYRDMIYFWLNSKFDFNTRRDSGVESLPFMWSSLAGVEFYGNENPFRMRVKVLDEHGNLKYGSLLMKMCARKDVSMSEIKDNVGVEFVVRDDDARRNLVGYTRREIRGTGVLESFKEAGSAGADKRSVGSSQKYGATKFILRPPVEVASVVPFSRCYERVPTEVQILTLRDDKLRHEDPEVSHSEYKRRQFLQVFPLLFPREIYGYLSK